VQIRQDPGIHISRMLADPSGLRRLLYSRIRGRLYSHSVYWPFGASPPEGVLNNQEFFNSSCGPFWPFTHVGFVHILSTIKVGKIG